MKKLIFIQLAIVLSVLFVSSCKKGEVGPQGAQGERGEAGTRGANGNLILSGTGEPSGSLGAVGDYYLNTANAALYGPKTDAGWGKPIGLQGPRGATGATGPRGATGAQGPKGNRGETGPRGATGAQGPRGATGATGPRGATGAQGPRGEQGQAGSQIISGTSSPTADIGRHGDYYFQTSTGALFGPKTDAGWGAGIALRGVQGPKGDKGDTGARGPQGERGPKGDQGDPGTANVIYSEWIKADWNTVNARLRTFTINGIHALQDASKSSVHVYMRFGVETAHYALPYTEFWNDGNISTNYTFGTSYIDMRVVGEGMDINPFRYNEIYYRYVVVPGGLAAAAQAAGVALDKLEAVSQAFDIPMN